MPQTTEFKSPGDAQRQTVHVALGERSYDILVGYGLMASAGEQIARIICGQPVADGRAAVIVTNPQIGRIYGEPLQASLQAAGFPVLSIALPGGETFKTLKTVQRAYDALYEAGVDRRSVVIALGGGVIGDIAGFAAASYLRGLDFVQIPTTLLSQVDSSVGGKVGVNFKAAKNSVGAFYQPKIVLIDPDTLRTLPLGERRSGLAEVIKYGAIADAELFDSVARETTGLLQLTSDFLETAITRSCEIKARIVEQDERETGALRATLNFGHTVGHALEAVTRYRMYRHGEAIAIGMVSACLVGEELGVTAPDVTQAVAGLLTRAGFRIAPHESIEFEAIIRLLSHDKKAVGGSSRFVLLERLGHATSGHYVTDEVVRAALSRQRGWKPGNISARF